MVSAAAAGRRGSRPSSAVTLISGALGTTLSVLNEQIILPAFGLDSENIRTHFFPWYFSVFLCLESFHCLKLPSLVPGTSDAIEPALKVSNLKTSVSNALQASDHLGLHI